LIFLLFLKLSKIDISQNVKSLRMIQLQGQVQYVRLMAISVLYCVADCLADRRRNTRAMSRISSVRAALADGAHLLVDIIWRYSLCERASWRSM